MTSAGVAPVVLCLDLPGQFLTDAHLCIHLKSSLPALACSSLHSGGALSWFATVPQYRTLIVCRDARSLHPNGTASLVAVLAVFPVPPLAGSQPRLATGLKSCNGLLFHDKMIGLDPLWHPLPIEFEDCQP